MYLLHHYENFVPYDTSSLSSCSNQPPSGLWTSIAADTFWSTTAPNPCSFPPGSWYTGPYSCISAGVISKFRYQHDCLDLPQVTLTDENNNTTIVDAGTLSPQQLIDNFNDDIAEGLLPLHPEYCKLAFCNDSFDKKLTYIDNYQEAEILGMHKLDSILAHDPLNSSLFPNGAITAWGLSHFDSSGLTGSNASFLHRIDTFSMEQAYCGCNSPEAFMYCKNVQHATEIQNMTLLNAELKDQYFNKLMGNYLANRNMRKQRAMDGVGPCGPCNWIRMGLVRPPVFPELFVGGNNITIDTAAPDWVEDVIEAGLNGSQFSNTAPAALVAEYNLAHANKCKTQVKKIMEGLGSCGMSSGDSTNVANYLVSNYCGIGANGAGITPLNVKDVLALYSIPLSDLCGPFLAEYGLFDEYKQKDRSKYAPRRAAFYSGLSSFLNRTEVKNALVTATASGGTSYASLSLTTGSNEFELALSQVLNNATSVSMRGYTKAVTDGGFTATYPYLVIQSGTYKDTIYFARRQLNSPPSICVNTGSPVTFQGAANSSLSFSNVRSIMDDPTTLSVNDGLIADNLVYASLNGPAPSTVACDNYAIWSRGIPMLKPRDAEALDYCVNCVQIKNAVNDYYTDTVTYKLPQYSNHPLYADAMSNYLNYKLKKSHTYEEYEKLMKGCALSDKILFKKMRGGFFVIFPAASLTAPSAFLTALNAAFPDINISTFLFVRTASSVVINVDLNSVPRRSLAAVKNYINAYSGPSKTYQQPPAYTTELFIKTGTCTPSIVVPNATVAAETVQVPDVTGTLQSYGWYKITSNSTDPLITAQVLQATKDYVNNPSITCSIIPFYDIEMMRSSDYSNPVKQSYLNYVYSLTGQSQDDISDKLAPAYLQANAGISAITNATMVTYKNTWCKNAKEDLYYYTTPGSTNAGFSRLNLILDRVKLQFSNALFSSATATTVSPGALGAGGTSLRAFKMSNGGTWYRLFDQQNRLFNTYIYPSEKMVGEPTGYHMASGSGALTIIPGADSIYRFKVKMEKVINGITHMVDCYGYTDFAIGAGKMLQNVVLYDHQNNRGCIDTANCERQLLLASVLQGKILHDRYIDSIKLGHFLAMRQHFPSNSSDNLWLSTQKQQYQYTLYYYDRAGNLTRTIPPAGVDTLSPYNMQFVDGERNNGGLGYLPLHKKISKYRYNSHDQLVWQETPDAGVTEFFYDASGKLTFSQNARQKATRKYSYTIYDNQGRIAETGAIGFTYLDYSLGESHPFLVKNAKTYQMGTIADQVRSKPREDVVATFYDNGVVALGTQPGMSEQQNLRKRVSCILYAPFLALNQSSESYYAYGTHFSYDALGNVSTLIQDNPYMDYMGQRFKRVDYDYDLLSGKVNMVSYNRSRPDQFYQKYEYDADNRITKAQSSKDGLIWDRDAEYEYYKHGPLSQMQVGDLNVQSIQYAYTIQGWLKAINGDVLRPEDDMGKDGLNGGLYPKDAFTHALGYHKDDYQQIGTTPATLTDNLALDQRSLYNGNIVRQTTGIHSIENLQRSYKYDQMNRLKNSDYASVSNDLNHTVIAMANAAFKNSYTYDADGNIKTLLRKDATGTTIDQLTYNYPDPSKNRLGHVTDVAANGVGTDLPTGQVAGNYQYDAIGNLVKDQQGEISKIYWNLYGKVSQMEIASANNVKINYNYDGGGNRVRKDVFIEQAGDTLRKSDVYVRDASGNILAVYKGVSKINQGLTIQWLNDNITQEHGGWITPQNTGLSPWLNWSFGNNGQFTMELMQTALNVHPSWTENQSNSLNWAQYMQLSDGIYSQAIHENIHEYFSDMVKDNPSILVEAFSGGNNSGFRRTFQGLADDGTKSLQTLEHFSQSSPDMCIEVMQSVGLHPDGLDASQRAASLSGFALSNGSDAVWYGFIESAQNHDPVPFYNKLIKDGSIITIDWLKDNSAVADDIRNGIKSYSSRVATSEFFQQWLYNRNSNWLNVHTAPEERLHVVYNNDQNTFMTSYLDNIGVTAVNTALSHIAQLTIGNYLQQVFEGVVTGTLNPTYDPPDINTPSPQNLAADTLYLAEHHLYGSSRLGIKKYEPNQYRVIYAGGTSGSPAVLSDSSLNIRRQWYDLGFDEWIKKDKTTPYTGFTSNVSHDDTLREIRRLGSKYYEMTDHLGNVLATVMDRKSGYGNTSGLYNGFYANLASVSDYYPFGFGMKERMKTYNDFRFGFSGKENDDEVYGVGNFLNFDARVYDSRLGRWLSRDPDYSKYASLSPYNAMNNSPIYLIDPSGRGAVAYKTGNNIQVKATIFVYTHEGTINAEEVGQRLQRDINFQLNHPVILDGTGKVTGQATPKAIGEAGADVNLSFDVTVKAVTYEQAAELAKENNHKMDYSVNFMELSSTKVSQVDNARNSGVYNMGDIYNRGSSTGAHEFGHLTGYFYSLALKFPDNGNIDNEFHAPSNETNDIMWRGLLLDRSEISWDDALKNRRVTPSFYNRINGGKGFKEGWNHQNSGRPSLNMGYKPDNVVNPKE
jgi:RHS repeat-associated protein